MPRYLAATLAITATLAASIAVAKERSELEKSTIKAASDCVAAAALNNQNITVLYRQNRLKEVTDWIVLKSNACDHPLQEMRLLHDRLYGAGTGLPFLLGDYLADLPRAVRERIRDEVEKRIAKGSGNESSPPAPLPSQFVNHNGSLMLMQIDASKNQSQIKIYYYIPSDKMRSLVARGTLFFNGTIAGEAGLIVGTARTYKLGCRPLEYNVSGVFRGQLGFSTLDLQGPAPTFGRGCVFDGYALDHNSTLTFEPASAHQQ